MIQERRIKKRDLNKLDILIKDTSNEFLQAFDVPDSLPQGRSSFTINGSEFLKTNTEVLVEILDNDNNPILLIQYTILNMLQCKEQVVLLVLKFIQQHLRVEQY